VKLPKIRHLIDNITTVDFETRAIGPRPHGLPPEPVGVAIRWPNNKAEYLRWGHPTGNNCERGEAAQALELAWRGPVLFHNAKFDLEVAWQWFHTQWPRRWDDTLFMLFLHEAHAPTFSLKPSCERLFGQEPKEQNVLHDWIMANIPGVKRSNAGAFIANAPGDLVEPYAIGDVMRTHALYKHLAPSVLQEQETPYEREKRLMPHLVMAERRGIRVDRIRLTIWHQELTNVLNDADQWIYRRLGKTFNIDSGTELADALDAAKVMGNWEMTPTGKRSTAKGALLRCCDDLELVQMLNYRGTADTMANTFVGPWIASSAYDSRLHTNWNQVRGVVGDGARTGRIASGGPNLANVPNPARIAIPEHFTALPELRTALLPEEGEEWVAGDYNSQELRISAHYEDGPLLKSYLDNPLIDQHQRAAEMIATILKRAYVTDEDKARWRRVAKTCAFLIIYGGGVRKLAQQLNCSLEEATLIRNAYYTVNPGLRGITLAVSERARCFGVVRSLGGRMLKPEPPELVADPTDDDPDHQRMQDYLYKMFNKLVQGGAADQTKEAIIKFCESGNDATMLVQVYDEIGISTKPGSGADERLRDCMVNALPIDTPMVVEIERGPSWGELQ
jgi:DNA polymerase-1